MIVFARFLRLRAVVRARVGSLAGVAQARLSRVGVSRVRFTALRTLVAARVSRLGVAFVRISAISLDVGSYTPSLDFSNGNNSMYLGAI